jgi:hypothetical protein
MQFWCFSSSLLLAATLLACSSGHAISESDADGGADEAAAPSRTDAGSTLSGHPADAGAPPPASSTGLIAEPDDAAAYIYDQSALRDYFLDIAPEQLAVIDADPRAEQYVPATLTFEGASYAVQARYKGSIGAFRGCVGDGGFNAMGAKSCTKLSMKVAFDQVDPEGRFHGLRKLQFHAMVRDPSMLKERLGYSIFREQGLPAPRAVHARLVINGTLSGLYALVEQVDGRFTRSRFTDGGEGNLYKEAWPIGMDRIAADDAYLRPRLETNEDQNPSLDKMLRFGQALQAASFEQLPEVLARFTDRDALMRYAATDRTLAHDDGPFHWYCGGGLGNCSNHNFFIYEEQRDDRLWVVAWDFDSIFNLDNVVTTIAFSWDDTTLGCGAVVVPPAVQPVVPPSCDKLTLGLASMQPQYLEQVRALLDGPLERERVEAKLAAWEAQIEPVVIEAASLHADAIGLDAWSMERAKLRAAIETLRQRAETRLQIGPISVFDPY